MNRKKKKTYFGMEILIPFIIVFYFIILIISYYNKSHIYSYQVKEGSLAVSSTYTGIALRQEEIHQSSNPGYITYLAQEGEHVGVGDFVYCIDESGEMKRLLEEANANNNSLSNQDLSELKNEIVDYRHVFRPENFSVTYDFLYSLDGTILKLANNSLLQHISELNTSSYTNLVQLCAATNPGYVVYYTDGYEGITKEHLTREYFDSSTYEKTQLLNNHLIDRGSPVYKLITSELWQIAIPLEEERALALADDEYVTVRFLENQRQVTVQLEVIEKEDGYYGILSFNNSVISFCTQRFIDIEIMSTEETGLKIPISSIVHREFYLVPAEYVLREGEENRLIFQRKCFNEDGTTSTEEIEIEVYKQIDNSYYVDNYQLKPGDYLVHPSTNEEYPIGARGELLGVYNINKGYAEFRQIEILYENEEYAIVKSGSNYGLNVYDFIVIDASGISENDFIYK